MDLSTKENGKMENHMEQVLIFCVGRNSSFLFLYFQVNSTGLAGLYMKENLRMDWNMEKVCQIGKKEKTIG